MKRSWCLPLSLVLLTKRAKRVCFSILKFFYIVAGNYDGSCEDSQSEALVSGANDVIVVKRADGSYHSTGWQCQVGKLEALLQSRDGREVTIFVGSVPARAALKVCDSGLVQFQPCRGCSAHHMPSNHLRELNLKPGANEAKFVVSDLDIIIPFKVFLFEHDDKLVLTDIDGTITETDLKGQVLPHLGISAHHKAVVELFSKIEAHGYKVVYLTARSLAQSEDSRKYLFNTLQNISGFSLPQGPVLMSPTSFISGLIAEVVTRTPAVQKTKTVKEIQEAFNNLPDTIVAGYGNKDTDKKAYEDSGISSERIFIVNPEGELTNIGTEEVSSYGEQVEQIHSLYPDILSKVFKYL